MYKKKERPKIFLFKRDFPLLICKQINKYAAFAKRMPRTKRRDRLPFMQA